jgi:hypothetical protein
VTAQGGADLRRAFASVVSLLGRLRMHTTVLPDPLSGAVGTVWSAVGPESTFGRYLRQAWPSVSIETRTPLAVAARARGTPLSESPSQELYGPGSDGRHAASASVFDVALSKAVAVEPPRHPELARRTSFAIDTSVAVRKPSAMSGADDASGRQARQTSVVDLLRSSQPFAPMPAVAAAVALFEPDAPPAPQPPSPARREGNIFQRLGALTGRTRSAQINEMLVREALALATASRHAGASDI